MSTGNTREEKVASLDANHLSPWNVVANMSLNIYMLQYHEALLNGYLDLLLFHQKYASVRLPKKVNKTLNEWICHQHTLIGAFKNNNPDNKFGKYNEQQYIKRLNAVGIDWLPKAGI
jgi:hypothetical protein